jgi:hypothetical protein
MNPLAPAPAKREDGRMVRANNEEVRRRIREGEPEDPNFEKLCREFPAPKPVE